MDLAGTVQEVMELNPDINRVYYMAMMTVEQDYREKGIAGHLISKSLEIAKEAERLSRPQAFLPEKSSIRGGLTNLRVLNGTKLSSKEN